MECRVGVAGTQAEEVPPRVPRSSRPAAAQPPEHISYAWSDASFNNATEHWFRSPHVGARYVDLKDDIFLLDTYVRAHPRRLGLSPGEKDANPTLTGNIIGVSTASDHQ